MKRLTLMKFKFRFRIQREIYIFYYYKYYNKEICKADWYNRQKLSYKEQLLKRHNFWIFFIFLNTLDLKKTIYFYEIRSYIVGFKVKKFYTFFWMVQHCSILVINIRFLMKQLTEDLWKVDESRSFIFYLKFIFE